MRVPTRRYDVRPKAKDPVMTVEKVQELQKKLERLKNKHPKLSQEVQRLAEMGDFSENAAYQIAKGKLRGLNNKILEIEARLNRAEVINPNADTSEVQLGHSVTVELNGQNKTYKILGSTEINPTAGIISRHSPLGSQLLGRKLNEEFEIILNKKTSQAKIISIK